MVLGTYDLIDLEKCQYRYFLKSRAEIFGKSDDIYGTSLRFLGIVVHKIFEKITDKIYMNIKRRYTLWGITLILKKRLTTLLKIK